MKFWKISSNVITLKRDTRERKRKDSKVLPMINFWKEKVNLDIFSLRDESLEDSGNLPPTNIIAEKKIVENFDAVLEKFCQIEHDLKIMNQHVEHLKIS